MLAAELALRTRKARMTLSSAVGYASSVILVELGNFLTVHSKILCFITSCPVVGFVSKLDRYSCALNALRSFCGCCIHGIPRLFATGDILGL